MLCFLRDGDRVLLLHRNNPPNAGQWDGVGGKLEPGEDPYAACIREVREETALSIEAPTLRALMVITVRSTGHLWTIFVFIAQTPGGMPVASDEGELAWVEMERVSSFPIIPDLPIMLPYLFDNGGFFVFREELEAEEAASATSIEIIGR